MAAVYSSVELPIERSRRRLSLLSRVSLVAVMTLFSAPVVAHADIIQVIDVIPHASSAEIDQSAEPSLAVNPVNPNTMIAATFDNTATGTPYWKSADGGSTWSGFDNLPSSDKSMAWRQDGVAALTTTLNVVSDKPFVSNITTFQSGATNFGSAINTTSNQGLDQPWIRTGPSGQTYVTYNNLSNASGKTASIIVSGNNGSTYGSQITLETVAPNGGQDAPSVRTAVNGSTIYAVFTRWGTRSEKDSNGERYANSQVVVVKSTNSGASFSGGVTAANTTGYITSAANTPLTLGQERTGSDVAVAVDPNNANHVVVAYGDAPGANGSGLLQLHVVESTDGGSTWTSKFATSSTVRSALPGLSILANGDIGLLYASYDPRTDKLSQHLLTTSNDFATTIDSLLGTESNGTPTAVFDPYLGDFYDLTSVSNTFYGIFSASNDDDGSAASFANAVFQRDFVGIPGTPSFGLVDASDNPVATSIDPFVFSLTPTPVPEPAALTLLGTALLGFAGLHRRRK